MGQNPWPSNEIEIDTLNEYFTAAGALEWHLLKKTEPGSLFDRLRRDAQTKTERFHEVYTRVLEETQQRHEDALRSFSGAT
jgi:hypothetical protein